MNEQPDQIVNYVWINERPFPSPNTDDEEKLCGVPLHYIDRALENAARYPHAHFNIWTGWRFLDDASRLFFDSHLYFKDAPNVRSRDLTEIPAPKTQENTFTKKPYRTLGIC